jgi:hypothetical protein
VTALTEIFGSPSRTRTYNLVVNSRLVVVKEQQNQQHKTWTDRSMSMKTLMGTQEKGHKMDTVQPWIKYKAR